MAFTVTDFEDLLKLLGQHPEWQAELRRILVGDQFAAIDARLEALTAAIVELRDAQAATQVQIASLVERMDQVALRLGNVETHLGSVRGWQVESRLKERIPGYFGRVLRKPRPVSPFGIGAVESAYDQGRISDADWRSLGALDILVEGGRIEEPSYLAIEASAVVDRTDVQRASDGAAILRSLGLSVVPWVAGESILENASELADQLGVQKLVAPGLAS